MASYVQLVLTAVAVVLATVSIPAVSQADSQAVQQAYQQYLGSYPSILGNAYLSGSPFYPRAPVYKKPPLAARLRSMMESFLFKRDQKKPMFQTSPYKYFGSGSASKPVYYSGYKPVSVPYRQLQKYLKPYYSTGGRFSSYGFNGANPSYVGSMPFATGQSGSFSQPASFKSTYAKPSGGFKPVAYPPASFKSTSSQTTSASTS